MKHTIKELESMGFVFSSKGKPGRKKAAASKTEELPADQKKKGDIKK